MPVVLPDQNICHSNCKEAQNKSSIHFLWQSVLQNQQPLYSYQKHKEEDVEAKLPEFSIESNFNLDDFTYNLGINDIFTSKANFSPLLNDLPIKVDSIIQKAYIKVDRDGTKAAAITAMMIRLASLSHSHYVYLNRPFIYAIIDKENDGLAPFVGLFLAE